MSRKIFFLLGILEFLQTSTLPPHLQDSRLCLCYFPYRS